MLLRLDETEQYYNQDTEPQVFSYFKALFWSGYCGLPDLTSQSFELALELLVGLLLLIQVSLQLLLAVLQSVDLLLGLIHLPFQGL